MKRVRGVLVVAAFLGVSLLAGNCGAGKPGSAEQAYRKFVGEWVNLEYPGVQPNVQKVVIREDFAGEDWDKPGDAASDGVWDIKVHKCWTDWKGSTYCQFYYRYVERYPERGPALMRVSRNGKVLELNTRWGQEGSEYPENIDPKAVSGTAFYFKYYRK